MSQAAHFFIEYRRKGEPEWELWRYFAPISEEEYKKRMAEAKKHRYMTDDLLAREEPYSGLDAYYTINDRIVEGGDLRDTFRISDYFCEYDPGMMHEGLPEDMSIGIAAWDEAYREHIKTQEYGYDWRGRIYWFTLGDLSAYVDKLQEKVWEGVKRYVREIVDAGVKEDLDEIKRKLDSMDITLEEIRSNKRIPHDAVADRGGEDDERPEDRDTVESAWAGLEECVEYDVRHYGAAKGLYETVYNIVHRYLSPEYGDGTMEARLIYYIN